MEVKAENQEAILEIDQNKFHEICRLCLKTTQEELKIIKLKYGQASVVEMLMEAFNFEVQNNEKLPEHICMSCLAETVRCYEFRNQCERSKSILEHIVALDSNKQQVVAEEKIQLIVDGVKFEEDDFGVDQSDDYEEPVEESLEIKEGNDINSIKIVNVVGGVSIDSVAETDAKEDTKKTFECYCKQSFSSKSELHYHKKKTKHQNKTGTIQTCPICNKSLKYPNLQQHMLIHSKDKQYKCEICSLGFAQNSSLRWHMMTHGRPDKIFICEHCSKAFPHEYLLKKHLKRHYEAKFSEPDPIAKKQYTCSCDRVFTSQGAFKQHKIDENHQTKRKTIVECPVCKKSYRYDVYLSHKLVHAEVKPYKCEICSKTFTQTGNLNRHMVVSHGPGFDPKAYVCDKCGQHFAEAYLLNRHMKRHEKVLQGEPNLRKYVCSCDMGFSSQMEYNLHRKETNHASRRKHLYPCPLCDKSYPYWTLKTHMATHSDEKPFQCDVCLKQFKLNGSLTEHMRIHSEEKPFVCELCEKAFTKSFNLKRHKQWHHPEGNTDQDQDGISQKRSTKRKSAASSITIVKSKEKIPYLCTDCGELYEQLSDYMQHIEVVHEGKGGLKIIGQN